jgi:hypothetical protein
MPTSRELVANKPLRGDELQKIVESDLHEVLSRDCMFTSRVAYGRVSYEVRVTLHMDNPSFPTATSTIRSAPRSDNQIEAQPEMAAIKDAPPLVAPTADAYVSSVERHRDIESPNATRIEHGLPISVIRTGHDTGGNPISVEEPVVYPKESVEGMTPEPVDTDLTRMVKQDWVGKGTTTPENLL